MRHDSPSLVRSHIAVHCQYKNLTKLIVEEVKDKISKETTVFKVGGFRPENTIQENWIGKVFVFKSDENIPLDKNGELMFPLAQIYIPNLPFIHPKISNTKILTVFISNEYPECFEIMGNNCMGNFCYYNLKIGTLS